MERTSLLSLRLARAWRRNRKVCACLLLWSLGLIFFPGSFWLSRLSFDLPLLFRSSRPIEQVVIVAVENDDMDALRLGRNEQVPRALYAQLLSRLKQAGARLVIFDYVFDSPSREPDDELFSRSLKECGFVILGGYQDAKHHRYQAPIERFRKAAAGWGLLDLIQDPDDAVRRLYLRTSDSSEVLYAPACAASLLDGSIFRRLQTRGGSLWLNYPGPPSAAIIPVESFTRALDTNTVRDSFFAGKVVIVSRRDELSPNDRFSHPWSRWGVSKAWGDELHAIAMSNLLRGDPLRKISSIPEALLVSLWLFVITFLLPCYSARTATLTWAAGTLGLIFFGVFTETHWNLWWTWVVPVLAGTIAFFWNVATRAYIRGTVFISYRREDAATALWINSELSASGFDSFLDVKRLKPGENWSEHLLEEVQRRETFIPIITRQTFENRRQEDFLLREMRVALQSGRRILPVIVDGFKWEECLASKTDSEGLDVLKRLSGFQGVPCSSSSAQSTMQKILEGLKEPVDQ